MPELTASAPLLRRQAAPLRAGRSYVTRPRVKPRRRLHVLDEPLFRDLLVKERKRADRSNEPFLLLLVALDRDRDGSAAPMSPAVVSAVAAAACDTDLIGWHKSKRVLGVLVPALSQPGAREPREVDAALRRRLAARLDTSTLARISVRLHVHAARETGDREAATDSILAALPTGPRQPAHRRLAKRGLDVLGSLTLLAVLSPLFAIIALLQKFTSPGPILFRQERVGEQARRFTMLKFRTMRVNADAALHQQYVTAFIKSGAAAVGQSGIFKIDKDPRTTPLGRILRKTSLDELPQFWNVLRGDMSLVGPRPPIPYELEQYQPWHRRRVLEAKPGITGLWQVTGRSRTTFDEMVRLDLRYVRSCSLWTDIKILLATPRAVITGRGAC